MLKATDLGSRIPAGNDRYYWASALCFVLGLLTYQGAVVALPILLGIVLVAGLPQKAGPPAKGDILRTLVAILPLVLIFAAYYGYRDAILSAYQASSFYRLHLGVNVLRNTVLLLGALGSPVSPHRAFVAWHAGDGAGLAAMAVVGLVFVVLLLAGCAHVERRKLIFLGAAFVLSCGLYVLLPRTSESYAHRALPVFSLIFGLSIGALIQKAASRDSRWRQGVIIAAATLVLSLNAWASFEKITLMTENGRLARILHRELATALREAPRGGTVLLFRPAVEDPAYSVLLVPRKFDLISTGVKHIVAESGRTDLQVRFLSSLPQSVPDGTVVYAVGAEGKLHNCHR